MLMRCAKLNAKWDRGLRMSPIGRDSLGVHQAGIDDDDPGGPESGTVTITKLAIITIISTLLAPAFTVDIRPDADSTLRIDGHCRKLQNYPQLAPGQTRMS